MLAYNNSDNVAKIKTSILSHHVMRDRFSCLSGCDNNVDNQLLSTNIIEKYTNMRGTYFVRHKKENSMNQIQKLVDSQVTRTKVAAVFNAKKGGIG